MMIGCSDASKLTSKKLDAQLTFYEKVKLKFHLFMCAACKMFQSEIKVIEEAYSKSAYSKADLSKESKEKIQNSINLVSI